MTYDYDGKTGMLRPNHKHVDEKGKPMRLPGGFNLPVEQRSTLQEFMKSNLSGFSELTKIQLDNYIDNIPASSYREMMAFLFRAKNGKECEWIAKHKPVNDNVGPDLKSQVQPKVRRDEVEPDVVPEAGPSKKRKRVALYADGGRHSVLPDSKPSTSGALYAPYGNGNSSRRNASSSSRRSEPVAPGNTNTPDMVIMARSKNGDVYSKTKLQQGEWPKEVIHYTAYDSSINIDRDNHINASNIIRGHKTDKVQGFFVTPLTPKDSTEEKIVNEIIGTNQYGGRSNRARILYKIDTSRLPEGTHIWKVSYSKDVFIVEPPGLDKSLKIISSKTSTDEKVP
ncbi:hypothetical protein [Pantoea cypripedii]|nr:hypothetical protein [Pantoea cypripedii]